MIPIKVPLYFSRVARRIDILRILRLWRIDILRSVSFALTLRSRAFKVELATIGAWLLSEAAGRAATAAL